MQRNAGKPLIDLIKRVTTKIGTVENLYGSTFVPASAIQTTTSLSWFVLQGTGNTPNAVFLNASSLPLRVTGENGVVSFDWTPSEDTLLLYSGVILNIPSHAPGQEVPFTVDAPGADITLYVNDNPIIRGTNTLHTTALLKPGKSVVAITLAGGSGTVTVTTSPTLKFGELPDAPQAPEWADTPLQLGLYNTLEDTNIGTKGVNISWYTDDIAARYIIEKTTYKPLGTIISVSEGSGDITLEVSGDFSDERGELLVGGEVYLGLVDSAEYVEEEDSTFFKVITDLSAGSWVNKTLYINTTKANIATVTRSGLVTSYLDTDIKDNTAYSYRIIAVHPVHTELQSATTDPVIILVPAFGVIPGAVGETSQEFSWVSTSYDLTVTNVGCEVIYDDNNYPPGSTIALEPAGTLTVLRPEVGEPYGSLQFAAEKDGVVEISTFTILSVDASEGIIEYPDLTVTQVSSTNTQVVFTASVTASVPVDIVVTLVGVIATVDGSPFAGGVLAAGKQLVVHRPAFGNGSGTVTFTATIPSGGTERIQRTINPVQRDTVGLLVRATPLTSLDPNSVRYRVAVADPQPGSGDVTLTYVLGTVSNVTPASPQVISAANITNNLDTTGYVDFTIERPTAGVGRITWTATRTDRASGTDAVDIPALPEGVPTIDYLKQEYNSEDDTLIDVELRVSAPESRGGRVYVWVDPEGLSTPDPTNSPDGYYDVTSTPKVLDSTTDFIVQGSPLVTAKLLKGITTNAQESKTIYVEFIDSLNRSTGKQAFVLKAKLRVVDSEGNLLDKIIDSYKFVEGLRAIRTVDELPEGPLDVDVVFLTTDSKLYRWDGIGWTAAVETADLTGQISSAQIANQAITFDKFAPQITPIEKVDSLPNTSAGDKGRVVFLTTDGKLYRCIGAGTGAAGWTAAVPTSDLSGTITTGQIADGAITTVKLGNASVTSSKIGDNQITTAKIANASVTSSKIGDGAVTEAKIGDAAVTTQKLQDGAITRVKFDNGLTPVERVNSLPNTTANDKGRVVFLTTDNKLYRCIGAGTGPSGWTAEVPTTDLSGEITTTQIADNAISAPKIAANAVTAGKIAANAVTADTIAANAVTAGKIAAGAVAAEAIAANAVVADKIAANAVTAGKIAANAVTTEKLAAESVIADKIAAEAITADKLAADAVTANKIKAGEIQTSHLATGSVTASRLLITDTSNLVTNPSLSTGTSAGWTLETGVTIESTDVFPDAPANYAVAIPEHTGFRSAYVNEKIRIDVTPGETFYISAAAISTPDVSSPGIFSIIWETPNGSLIFGEVPGIPTWAAPQTTWLEKSSIITVPEGVVKMGLYIQTQPQANPQGTWYFTNFRWRKATGTTLIENGAITTPKVAAAAIDASRLNIAQHILSNITWTNNSPGAGRIAWSTGKLYYEGVEYTISAGNTANANLTHIWWKKSSPNVFQATNQADFDSQFNQADGDALIAINEGGVANVQWNATQITGGAIKTNSIHGDKIVANSITAGKIAAGAIGADQLAANSITAEKIAVADLSNLVANAEFEGASVDKWTFSAGAMTAMASTEPEVPAGAPSRYVARCFSHQSGSRAYRNTPGATGWIEVTPGETLYLEVWVAARDDTDSGIQLRLYRRTKAGSSSSTTIASLAPTTTWTKLSGHVTIPANYYEASFAVVTSGGSGTQGYWYVASPKMVRSAGVFIEPGGITTEKLAAASVTASKLYIGDATNFIPNPWFENLEAWEYNQGFMASMLRSETEVPTGAPSRYVARLTCYTSNRAYAARTSQTNFVPVIPGEKLYIEFWAASTADASTSLQLRFNRFNTTTGGVSTETVYTVAPPQTTWTKYSFYYTVPTNYSGLQFVFYIPANPSAAGYWYIAQPKIFRASGVTIEPDGITAEKIKAGEILTQHIAAGAITAEKIKAGEITTNHLNFTAVESDNVIGAINASSEGVRISGSKIHIDGSVTFSSDDFDPRTKETPTGAQNKANAAKDAAIAVAEGDATAKANAAQAAAIAASLSKAEYLTSGTTTIDGGKITADSITAAQIGAGVIGAKHIAAGAITASKLLIKDTTNLVTNPDLATGDTSGWAHSSTISVVETSNLPDSSNAPAPYALAIPVGDNFRTAWINEQQFVPVQPGETFYVSYWAMSTPDANSVLSGQVMWKHKNGTITHGGIPGVPGWGTPQTTWQEKSNIVTIPANVVGVCLYFQTVPTASPQGTWYLTNFRFRKAVGATLIEDGSITTNKLAFVAAHTGNIIAQINASTEDSSLRISGSRIRIDGNVVFASPDLDPRNKATQNDINDAIATLPPTAVVIRSEEEPETRPASLPEAEGDPLQPGDIWIDTSDGDLPYTWSGTAWVPMYTQIDGGNIVTGTLEGDRLKANTEIVSPVVRDPNSRIVIDARTDQAQAPVISITDDQQTPVERVRIGKLGSNPQDYGIQIRNASGLLVLDATGAIGSVVNVPKAASVIEVMNGEEWDYSSDYDDPPLAVYVGGGITSETRDRWDIYLQKTYDNNGTGSGASASPLKYATVPYFYAVPVPGQTKLKFHCYLMAVTSPDPKSQSFSAAPAIAPGQATGTAILSASDLPAMGGSFVVQYQVSSALDHDNTFEYEVAIQVEVQVSTNSGSTWNTVASKWTTLYGQTNTTLSKVEQATVTASGTNVRWRLYYRSLLIDDLGGNLNTNVVGSQVLWDKEVGVMYASATPSPTTPAKFLLFAQR